MVTKYHPKNKECADNRELILDAAAELLKEFGYKKMTMDELAKHAGLGKGTVYLYFESKQDVALSYIDRQFARLRAHLREVVQSKRSARQRLHEMVIDRVMIRFQGIQGHKLGIDDLLMDLRPQLFDRRAKYHLDESKIFAELLIEGRMTGEFQLEDPFKTAEAFLDATNSLLPYSLSPKQLGEKSELLERVSKLADLLVRSVERSELQTNLTEATKY